MRPSILTNGLLWAWLAIAFSAGFLVWLLSPILAPFLTGAILAYIFDPIVERLTRRRVPRTLAVIVVLALALLLVVGFLLVVLPLFYKETRMLLERWPAFVGWFNDHVSPWLEARLDFDFTLDVDRAKQYARDMLSENDNVGKQVLGSLRVGSLVVLSIAFNVLLVPVVVFYLLRDWNKLLERVDQLIPRRAHAKARAIAAEIDVVLAEWLRGQVLVIAIMSVYYVSALSLTGLDFALPIGILIGVSIIIPYVGVAAGLLLATAAALMEFGTLSGLAWVWVAIGVGQALEGMFLTPFIVGERIGLHPVVVIFALLAFGTVFGFFGVLLALPASAVLLVALRHLRTAYLAGPLYGEDGGD